MTNKPDPFASGSDPFATAEKATDFHMRCPFCGVDNTRASALGTNKALRPGPGSLLLCVECGEWCFVTASGNTRKPRFKEYEAIAASFECTLVRSAWVAMDHERQQKKTQEATDGDPRSEILPQGKIAMRRTRASAPIPGVRTPRR